MNLRLKNLLISNAPLKVISFILGYTAWYLLGNIVTETRWYTIPLSFYNLNTELSIQAPKTIQLLLAGKRNYLKNIDINNLAAHVNGALLKEKKQAIAISHDQLFLPDSIKLIHYIPTPISVTITNIDYRKKKQNN